jgi:hypothetical protein
MTCPSKTTIERIYFNTTKDACQDVQKIKTRNVSNWNVDSSPFKQNNLKKNACAYLLVEENINNI